MRVLMIGWDFSPQTSGGLGPACAAWSAAMLARGVEVLYVSPANFRRKPQAQPRPDVPTPREQNATELGDAPAADHRHDLQQGLQPGEVPGEGIDTGLLVDAAAETFFEVATGIDPPGQADVGASAAGGTSAAPSALAGAEAPEVPARSAFAQTPAAEPASPPRQSINPNVYWNTDLGQARGRLEFVWVPVWLTPYARPTTQPVPVTVTNDVARAAEPVLSTMAPLARDSSSPRPQPQHPPIAGSATVSAAAGSEVDTALRARSVSERAPLAGTERGDWGVESGERHDQHAGSGVAAPAAVEPALETPAEPPTTEALFAEMGRYAQLVLAACQHESFDIVWAHDWLAFPAGVLLKTHTKKPLVAHVHSTEFDRAGLNADQRIYDIERTGCTVADRVTTVSHLTAELLADRYRVLADKISVIYSPHTPATPATTPAPAPATPAAPATPTVKRDPVVLFLGRLTDQKGVDTFLRAAKLVRQRVPHALFVMAGSGERMWMAMQLAAELGVAERVVYTGFLPPAEVASAFNQASVYVMPSASEPFGLSALEALNHRVPVILSRKSGASELLHHVLRMEPGDVEDLANKIVGVLRHRPLADMLADGSQLELDAMNGQMGWQTAADQMLGVFGRCLAGGAAPVVPGQVSLDQPIRGVLFDIGGTLMDESNRVLYSNAWLARELAGRGLAITMDELLTRYATAATSPQPGCSSLYVQMLIDLGFSEADARAIRGALPWDAVPLVPFADTLVTLDALRSAGLRIGILANQPRSARHDLEATGIADRVDDIWLSDDVGLAKPDPAFFQLALNHWTLPAQAVAYVGDRPDNDISPAKALGLHAVRVRLGFHATQHSADEKQDPDADFDTLAECAGYLLAMAAQPARSRSGLPTM